MEFPAEGDTPDFDPSESLNLPSHLVPGQRRLSAFDASDDSVHAVPSSYKPKLLSKKSPSEAPTDSVRDILRQHEGKPPDFLFDNLTQNVPSYQSPPSSVPPLDSSRGSHVYNGPDLQSRREQWEILGRMRKLCNSQDKVSSQRYALRQQRADLRTKRDDTAELGTELLDKLRVLAPKLSAHPEFSELSGPISEVVENFEHFQQTIDVYQEQETNYRQEERDLDKEEFRLEEAERDFQTELQRVEAHQSHQLTALFGEYREPSSEANNADAAYDARHGYHPLVYEYLSRVGDSNNLQENIWEISDERAALLEQQEMRQQYGLELGEEALADLENLNQTEKELLDEFAQVQEDMERLKLECDRQELDVDASPTSPPDEPDTRPSTASFNTSTHDLLDPWREKSPSYFETIPGIPELNSRINGARFMNKWLLDQLCLSSFQVLLRKTLVKEFPVVKVEDDEHEKQFRNSVLEAWSSDTAVDSMLALDTSEDKASRQPVDPSDPEIPGGHADTQSIGNASDAAQVPNGRSLRALEAPYPPELSLLQVQLGYIPNVGWVFGQQATAAGDVESDTGDHALERPTVMDRSVQTSPFDIALPHDPIAPEAILNAENDQEKEHALSILNAEQETMGNRRSIEAEADPSRLHADVESSTPNRATEEQKWIKRLSDFAWSFLAFYSLKENGPRATRS